MSDQLPERIVEAIAAEVAEEFRRHPQGYTTSRDGVRYAIANIEDELHEMHEAWQDERRGPEWEHTRAELLQVIGNGVRLLIALDEAGTPAGGKVDCTCPPCERDQNCHEHGDNARMLDQVEGMLRRHLGVKTRDSRDAVDLAVLLIERENQRRLRMEP